MLLLNPPTEFEGGALYVVDVNDAMPLSRREVPFESVGDCVVFAANSTYAMRRPALLSRHVRGNKWPPLRGGVVPERMTISRVCNVVSADAWASLSYVSPHLRRAYGHASALTRRTVPRRGAFPGWCGTPGPLRRSALARAAAGPGPRLRTRARLYDRISFCFSWRRRGGLLGRSIQQIHRHASGPTSRVTDHNDARSGW